MTAIICKSKLFFNWYSKTSAEFHINNFLKERVVYHRNRQKRFIYTKKHIVVVDSKGVSMNFDEL